MPPGTVSVHWPYVFLIAWVIRSDCLTFLDLASSLMVWIVFWSIHSDQGCISGFLGLPLLFALFIGSPFTLIHHMANETKEPPGAAPGGSQEVELERECFFRGLPFGIAGFPDRLIIGNIVGLGLEGFSQFQLVTG